MTFNFSDCSSVLIKEEKYGDFMKLTNDHLIRSFEYLFLSAQFGTHVKQRPGFEKILHGLADDSWNKGIEMIKELAKRGVAHKFEKYNDETARAVVHGDTTELESLALAADIEKNLLQRANQDHLEHSHAASKDKNYDAALAHYLEEEIIEAKTGTIRNLVGHVNNLKNIFSEGNDIYAMSLYLFDQILAK